MIYFVIISMVFAFAELPVCNADGKIYHENAFSGTPKDKIIQSENYPETYPRDLNVTWRWDVKTGFWGVVFEDFYLDSDSASEADWLELEDMQGRKVIYRASNPPVLSYMTTGPKLLIRFISDGVSKSKSRGFKLNVLYGKTERELQLKIHDATKQKPKEENGESSTIFVIIGVLIVLIVVIVLAVLYIFCKRRNDQRNAYGVRKNSGISHCRRAESQQQRPLTREQHHQEQEENQPDRSLQRFNSRNWVTRAELNTSLRRDTTPGRSRKPNIYTQTSATKDAVCKVAIPEDSMECEKAKGGTGRGERRNSNSDNANGQKQPGSSSTVGVTRSFSATNPGNGVVIGSQSPLSLPTSMERSLNIFATFTSCSRNVTRSVEGALNEYSDTVDSLNPRVLSDSSQPSDVTYHVEKPPPYNNFLQAPPPPYVRTDSAASSQCYENVSSNPTRPPFSSSQTNIYINARGLSSSTGSINMVTIDTSHSSAANLCFKDGKGSTPNRPFRVQIEDSEAKPSCSTASQRENETTVSPRASSTVHRIDGYAYIVPAANEQEGQPAASCNAKPDWSVHLDVVPDGIRASRLANDQGYIDMQTEDEVPGSRQIYINLEKESS